MNSKNTKRALLSSAIALLICFTMMLSTTFAWFTDTAVSGSNVIVSGKLDVALIDANDASLEGEVIEWAAKDGRAQDKILWEPGCTYETEPFYVKNNGNLALKYQVVINGIEGDAKLLEAIEWTVTIDGVKTDLATFEGKLYPTTAPKSGAIVLSGHMKEDAGNEYQDLTVNGISVSVFATQLDAESDTFGPEYDEEATYGTYVELNAGDNLLAAMASAEADMPLTIKLNGNVEWPTEGHHGENDITPASSILIDGNGYTITATGSGVTPLGDKEAPMTLKNVKIVDNSVSYNESAWELSYLEMGGRVLNCVNVDFADPISVDGDNSVFTDCTFVGHYDKNSTSTTQYGVWVANGDSIFTNCIFTGTRGMKICDQYASEVGTVIIDGCTFNGISEKPGVCIDDRDTQDMNIIIKNSTFIDCKAGDQNLYIYETDNTVPTLDNNKVFNDATFIGTAAELIAFANDVNVNGNKYSGKTVVLTNDIDLNNVAWTPIGQTGATEFKGIFDGQGYTIKNLNVDNSAFVDEHTSSGLFGWAESGVTIKNVNIDGATVKGNHNVAALVGYTYSAKVSNCHVSNATIVCNHANGDACGDKAGAIVGYAGNESRFSNCSASDSTITAGRDAGQLIGTGYNVSVSNCSATNVTVSATGNCNRESNINSTIIGRVMG